MYHNCFLGIDDFIISTLLISTGAITNNVSTTKQDIEEFTAIDPITIDGNKDFEQQAKTNGWTLDGSRDGNQANPYVISNYIINNPISPISIQNTDVFLLSNNIITSSVDAAAGVDLHNVEHGRIANNTISGYSSGIRLEKSLYTIIEKNHISKSLYGIFVYNSEKYTISTNAVDFTALSGIRLQSSQLNVVRDNKLHKISTFSFDADGIRLYDSTNNTIIDNSIANREIGLNLIYSQYNEIHLNTIANTSVGMKITQSSDNNLISSNTITNSSDSGMTLIKIKNNLVVDNSISVGSNQEIILQSASAILLSYNIINNMTSFAIVVDSDSSNCNIIYYQFIDNNHNSTQAQSATKNNIFDFNYWNEWTAPDADGDGIVDQPYQINIIVADANPIVSPDRIPPH